jgi:hypothetical protein
MTKNFIWFLTRALQKPTSHLVAATLSCSVVVFMCAKKLTALGLGFLPTTLFELTN